MSQAPNWSVSGDYFESCSCDYVCPCIYTNLTGKQTKGDCQFAMAFHINQGSFGAVSLDGLNFVVLGRAPGPTMADGNISVGVITDERASADQAGALTQIASGQAGGPMAALGPFVSAFLGTEARPIHIQKEGMRYSVSIPGALDQVIEGVPGGNPDQPLYIDNTMHPANTRLALAKASHSHLHALGLNWDDVSGQNNGQFAPFSWRSS